MISLPTLSTEAWNELLDILSRKLNLVVSGRLDAGGWNHRWRTRAHWHAAADRWELSIVPGFVNCHETETPLVNRDEAPEATLERLPDDPRVRPYLSESPRLAIAADRLRAIGGGATAVEDTEGVPEFFQALGVGEAARLDLQAEGLGGVSITLPSSDPETRRELRAVEVVLTTPQAYLDLSADVPGVDLPGEIDRPTIYLARDWSPLSEVGGAVEQLAAGLVSQPNDERLIATVYFLSPPGEAAGEVGPDWVPFVRQRLHYNLAMGFRSELQLQIDEPLSLTTGLAGGLADGIFSAQLAEVNAANAAASLGLSASNVEVEFWTV